MKDLLRYAERLALGIVLEVSAYPKPGNVHRFRDFSDTIYEDFLVTALTAVEPLFRGIRRGYKHGNSLTMLKIVYGDIIYDLVSLSRRISGGGNTCLGTALMLTPIAVALGYELSRRNKICLEEMLQTSCKWLKKYSTALDTVYLYKAIRVATPSYVRRSDHTNSYPNVWEKNYRRKIIEKNIKLWDILEYSSLFDIVARDIVECYPRSYKLAQYIYTRLKTHNIWNRAVVEAYIYQLSNEIDTLILRKKGFKEALGVKESAEKIVKLCENSWLYCVDELRKFDEELSSRGINPGSTADIVATAISLYTLTRPDNILRS